MVKIIDGKRYNTETATEIAHFWNGLSTSDFRNVSETLYMTKKGGFFLAGEGGPMSKYSQSYGNMTGGGSGIIPLCKSHAYKWCEKYADSDVIETHFSDMIEDA